MSIKADRRPPVNAPAVERIEDFSGGLNTTISGSLLNKNEAQIALDISFEQKGTIVPRRGRRRRYNVDFGSLPCTGLGAYYKKDGTSRLLVTSDDKIYSDAPHLSKKWDVIEDWEAGEHNGKISTSKVSGSLVLDHGQQKGMVTLTNGTAAGTANHTFGWEFKPKEDIRVRALRINCAVADKTYTATIWDTTDKEKVAEVVILSTEVGWRTKDLTKYVDLVKDIAYRITVNSSTASATFRVTGVTYDPKIEFVKGVTATSFIYPETDTNDIYGVDLIFDYTEHVVSYSAEGFDDGQYDNVTLEAGNVVIDTAFVPKTFSHSTTEDFNLGDSYNVTTSNVIDAIVLELDV